MQSARGRFIVLDGIDGCGKTTQAARLVRALTRPGAPPPLHLREPGATAAGERLRGLLLDPEVALVPAAQVLLFVAARRQMLEERVQPALSAGQDVVCERFHPSTFAYQGVGLGVGEDEVLELLAAWAGEPAPDVTVILDLDPALAARRRGRTDRYEARDERFHRRVAEGYRRYAARTPGVVLVGAQGSPEEVEAAILAEVEHARR